MAIRYDAGRRLFRIETGDLCCALAIAPSGMLCCLHMGGMLRREGDLDAELAALGEPHVSRGVDDELPWRQEYAVQEPFDYLKPALYCAFDDGSRGVRLHYQSHELTDTRLLITLKDDLRALTITLHYRLCATPGLFYRSCMVTNGGDAPVRIERFMSATLSLPAGDWHATYFTGHWGAEYTKNRSRLTQACLTLGNTRGVCASHQAVPFAALDTRADEEHGDVLFTSLMWSGDFRIDMEKDAAGAVRIGAGISDYDTVISLANGCSETTPELLVGYTAGGFGGMSKTLYDWQYDEACPQNKIKKPRPVIYNSWYPFQFAVDRDNCMAMLSKAKAAGAELFVIDDGWMKGRTNDKKGLGDWIADPARFPDGLKPIADACHEAGMLFGLWVEPEMINEDSDLYRQHPEWVLRDEGRPNDTMRNQLILDLSREDVTIFCIDMLGRLLHDCCLDYLKWDMNRYMSCFGGDRELRVRYIRNLYRVWRFMNEEYPDVLYENCASGGGRADFGMLAYADRINRSDNADPVDVMRIHEGFTTLYLPMLAGGAGNISPCPNGINGRAAPFSFRAISGLTGSMSIGVNLTESSEREIREIRRATDKYKALRGDLKTSYVLRLRSVDDGGISVLEYLRRDGKTAVVFAFGHGLRHSEGNITVALRGLQEDAAYSAEDGRTLSGAALMRRGVKLSLKGDYAAQVFVFHRVEA